MLVEPSGRQEDGIIPGLTAGLLAARNTASAEGDSTLVTDTVYRGCATCGGAVAMRRPSA